jgi:hypothetical protein
LAKGTNGGILEVKAKLFLSVVQSQEKSLKNVSLSFSLPKGVKMDDLTLTYPTIKSDTPLIIPLSFHALNNTFPVSRKVGIYASFQVAGSAAMRVSTEECDLPIGLFLTPISAPKLLKEAQYKLTLSVIYTKDQPLAPLSTLFKEIAEGNLQFNEILNSNPNLVALRYNNGCEIGILLAKSGGKYRIQSTKFEGIWFPLLYLHSLLSKCIS